GKCFAFFDYAKFIMGGLTLLAMGIWANVDGLSYLQILGPFSSQGMHHVNVGYFCIAIGALLVLLALLGCCGANKENKCLLLTFFSMIFIIFIAELAVAVVALSYSSFAEGILKAWASPALQKHYGNNAVVTKLWNTTMTQMNCCGFTSSADFVDSNFAKKNGGNLPPWCCRTNTFPCSPEEAKKSFVQGCFQQILESLKEHANIVGAVAAGIATLEVIMHKHVLCNVKANLHYKIRFPYFPHPLK
uniref:Tetraspanin n=1 Tax=Hippocampus comes TaxID=109280 RepID=A0A3Q2YZ88_HIPCM